MGLACPEGMLMCCTAGLTSFLGPQVEFGENVASLLGHPHWKEVQAFAVLTEAGCFQTVVSRLQRLVPMVKDRLLLVRGIRTLDLPELRLPVAPGHWLLRDVDIERFCLVSDSERSMLADRSLLPLVFLVRPPLTSHQRMCLGCG